jgi:mono/diheme cytochrome c family protein
MSNSPSTSRRSGGRRGPWALAVLAVASVVGVAVWWGTESAHRRTVSQRVAAWAESPLPAPGAPVDTALAALGSDVFQTHCAGCHALSGEQRVGPNLEGVTRRRSYAWIRSMVLHPDSMTRDDPVARALLQSYGVQMMVTGKLEAGHARALIEFLRRLDGLDAVGTGTPGSPGTEG